MTRLLLYINRRSGVAHVDRFCDAIASVPARYLRLEPYDSDRPRRLCSRCWNGGCPGRRAFAGSEGAVTEQSEGNPRSGLTDADGSATSATERAADFDVPRRSGLVTPDLLPGLAQSSIWVGRTLKTCASSAATS